MKTLCMHFKALFNIFSFSVTKLLCGIIMSFSLLRVEELCDAGGVISSEIQCSELLIRVIGIVNLLPLSR